MYNPTENLWIETKYRVVGFKGEHGIISWCSTVEQAIERADKFERASVYRPDGSQMGVFFNREKRSCT